MAIKPRVEFDDVGAHDHCGLPLQHRQNLTQGQPARFGVRHARGFAGVDAIKVDADIERAGEHRHLIGCKIGHRHDFHAEAFGLLAAMPVECPNADLHQPRGQASLHDPGERRGVAARVAVKIIIKIGMRVKVQDRHRAVLGVDPAHHRVGHRVIPAQRQGHRARLDCSADSIGNHRIVRCVFVQPQIAAIAQFEIDPDLLSVLTGEVAAIGPQRAADRGGGLRRAAFERRIDVAWQADQVDHGQCAHVSSSVDPVVRRASRSRWACSASVNA